METIFFIKKYINNWLCKKLWTIERELEFKRLGSTSVCVLKWYCVNVCVCESICTEIEENLGEPSLKFTYIT